MKIDSSSKSIGNLPGATNARAGGAAAGRAAGVSSAAVSAPAEQSSTVVATTLHTIADTEPAFNAKRVAEIRQAISEGQFQINPERIADGLLTSVREMLAQNRRNAS